MAAIIATKLPPSLLKLFSPRAPPTFFKPVGRDPTEPGPNKLDGLAPVLERVREEDAEKILKADETGGGTSEREGKEADFTLAPEWEKQVKKEKQKKQQEEYKKNLEKNCE